MQGAARRLMLSTIKIILPAMKNRIAAVFGPMYVRGRLKLDIRSAYVCCLRVLTYVVASPGVGNPHDRLVSDSADVCMLSAAGKAPSAERVDGVHVIPILRIS